ncbi:ATP-binding cassette sub-family G member 4 [Halotydeus destructor]|nr:ATP-binding cassette sub-family G member 4 [Halotydeus destructor]
MLRDPLLLVVRFMVHILCGLCLWAVFKDSGGADGCPPKVPQSLGKMDVFKEMQEAYLQDAMRTFTNSSAIFFCALFLLFTSMMPTVLTFSSEIDILRKEVFNKWYSVTPFYFAKIFAELPLLVILSIIYCTIFYFGLENPNVSWRYASFTGIMMLNCIIGHAQGTLVSVIFVDHPEAGIYFTPVSVVPALLLSGFFVHMKDMKYFMTIASYTTYVRFLVETAIVVVYGYDRCGVNLARDLKQAQHVLLTWVGTNMGFDNGQGMGYANASNLMGKFNPIETAHRLTGSIVGQVLNDYVGSDGEVRSRMLNEYTVDEDDVGPNIAIAIAILILYRILAYFILYRKVNLKT